MANDTNPIYILNSFGIAVPVGPSNPLPTLATLSTSSIALNDFTTPANHVTIDASGNLHIALASPLGQALMAASLPVTIASNQSNLPENLTQVGGSAIALGQAAMAASLPVTMANNQSNIPVTASVAAGASLAINDNGTPSQHWAIGSTGAGSVNLTQLLGNAVVAGTATGATLANILEIVLGLYNGSTADAWRGTQGVADVSSGGRTATAIAAGTAANTVIKGSAGRIASILVTTTGTNALQVFDNATTNTGTIIAALPASPAIGLYVFGLPAANGITVAGSASNPAVTVAFY